MKTHPVCPRMLPASAGRRPPSPIHEGPVTRGRYLPRHHARVLEQGNLFVVDFVERPDAAARKRAAALRKAVFLALGQVALLWGVALAVLTLSLMRLG